MGVRIGMAEHGEEGSPSSAGGGRHISHAL